MATNGNGLPMVVRSETSGLSGISSCSLSTYQAFGPEWARGRLNYICPAFVPNLESDYNLFKQNNCMSSLTKLLCAATVLQIIFSLWQPPFGVESDGLGLQISDDLEDSALTVRRLLLGIRAAFLLMLWIWVLLLWRHPQLLRVNDRVLRYWLLAFLTSHAFTPSRLLFAIAGDQGPSGYYGRLGLNLADRTQHILLEDFRVLFTFATSSVAFTYLTLCSRSCVLLGSFIPLLWYLLTFVWPSGQQGALDEKAAVSTEFAARVFAIALLAFLSVRRCDLQQRFVFLALIKIREQEARSDAGSSSIVSGQSNNSTGSGKQRWAQVRGVVKAAAAFRGSDPNSRSSTANVTNMVGVHSQIMHTLGQLTREQKQPRLPADIALWEWIVGSAKFSHNSDPHAVARTLLGEEAAFAAEDSSSHSRPDRVDPGGFGSGQSTGTNGDSGDSRESLTLGWPWSLLPDQELSQIATAIQTAHADEGVRWHSLDITFERPNGDMRRLRVGVQRAAKRGLVRGLIQDITEDWLRLTRVEMYLQRLESASSLFLDGWCSFDVTKLTVTEASNTLPAFFGVRSISGRRLLEDFMSAEDGVLAHDMIFRSLSEGHISARFQFRRGSKRGELFNAEVAVAPDADDPSSVILAFRKVGVGSKTAKDEQMLARGSSGDFKGAQVQQTHAQPQAADGAQDSSLQAEAALDVASFASGSIMSADPLPPTALDTILPPGGTVGSGADPSTVVSALMWQTIANEPEDLAGARLCSDVATGCLPGWLALPAPPLVKKAQYEHLLTCLTPEVRETATELCRTAEWRELIEVLVEPVDSLVRTCTGSQSFGDNGESAKSGTLPSIPEDEASVDDGEPNSRPVGRLRGTMYVDPNAIDQKALYADVSLLIHATVRLMQIAEPALSGHVSLADIQGNDATSCSSDALPDAVAALKALAQVVKSLQHIALAVSRVRVQKSDTATSATINGVMSPPPVRRFIRLLHASTAHTLVWVASAMPTALSCAHVTGVQEDALDTFLRYNLVLPAYGCMARFAGFMAAQGSIGEACQHLMAVRQQVVQGGKGRNELLLPAVLWNLAIAAKSGIKLAGDERSIVLEWMSLQRLRELPPPLPSWAEELLADLTQREAQGKLKETHSL